MKAPLKRIARNVRLAKPVNQMVQWTLGHPRWRHNIPAWMWVRLPVRGPFHVDVPSAGRFWYNSLGEPLGKKLFWRGVEGYEPGTADLFVALARTARTFIDIGGYNGYYVLLACTANPSLRAISFEPLPELRRWLTEHVDRNGCSDRVRIVPGAVSDRSEHGVTFFASPNPHSSGSSLVDGYKPENSVPFHIDTYSLDDYLSKNEVTDVDLVKIDVEGAEDRVLLGARKTLAEQRPTVLCEILPRSSESVTAIRRMLDEIGYVYGRVTANGIRQTSSIAPDETREDKNFLLWPKERDLTQLDGIRMTRA